MSIVKGIWISQEELMLRPMDGPAWLAVKKASSGTNPPPNLSDQNSGNNVITLAKAIVGVREQNGLLVSQCLDTLTKLANGSYEKGARALAMGRELPAYIIVADLLKLWQLDPQTNETFKKKILYILMEAPTSSGPHTLHESHLDRPNNWGTHATAAEIAVRMYLGDATNLDKAAQVFKGWLGDRKAYSGFKYGDLWWQADPANPVGINPLGATIQTHNVDGAQPEELRRQGSGFMWPPPSGGDAEMYAYEALQGAIVSAWMLYRAGYLSIWDWSDKALLRAYQWLDQVAGWKPEGDDRWQPPLVNLAYKTNYPVDPNATPGKNKGWTAFTHQSEIVVPEPTKFKLTLLINAGGTVTLQPGNLDGTYPEGTTVTLTANPEQGFHFVGWTGSLQGPDNPATLIMTGDRDVTANFAQDTTGGDTVEELQAKINSAKSQLALIPAQIDAVVLQLEDAKATMEEIRADVVAALEALK